MNVNVDRKVLKGHMKTVLEGLFTVQNTLGLIAAREEGLLPERYFVTEDVMNVMLREGREAASAAVEAYEEVEELLALRDVPS